MRPLLELHARVIRRSAQVVDRVRADQLQAPTPCAHWTLADLLAHMIAQHHGFAAAAEGNRDDLSVWSPQRLDARFATDYAAAADRVLGAFAAPDLEDRDLWLPEIRDGGPFPARLAVSFHLLDYVVHSWDVATAIGVPAELDADMWAAALAIAEQVPGGDARTAPGAAFGPVLAAGEATTARERCLLALGRSPNWPR